ncbi:hypothetical protein WCX49_04880 [Sulfurimonas sp. HSL-1656]|uniref:hypothetical protein n=1 Tax=Thiomicrolovo subterrani TaxID=3131934 RepID=UPI0031F7CB54
MKSSIDISKVLFAVFIFYILWGISFQFGGRDRLPELIICLLSFIFIFIPVLLVAMLVPKQQKPKDSNATTNERFEDYADRRIHEIEEALKQNSK